MTTIAVVVPTVRERERELERCLAGLAAQTRPPDELCVIRNRRGPVQALAAGWAITNAEWIAVLDDDARPDAEWLASLERHFADPSVGAVGGRIVGLADGRARHDRYRGGPVAALSFRGRTTSRLHDVPEERVVCDVSFLPGSNMCFRRAALPGLDPLLGHGMAKGFELALCLEVASRGYRVRFDSAAVVEHRPAPRPPHLPRDDEEGAAEEYARNLTYILLRWLPWPRKLAFAASFALVGDRAAPGLLTAPVFGLSRRSRKRLLAGWRGKRAGARIALGRRRALR